jgi:hypothetical protein
MLALRSFRTRFHRRGERRAAAQHVLAKDHTDYSIPFD